MSFVLRRLQEVLRNGLISKVPVRYFSRGPIVLNSDQVSENQELTENNEENVRPELDRRKPVPVETSILYMVSEAYKKSYGNEPVWKPYRRNHKGQLPPRKTRKTCIRQGLIATGNPCPICRDKYLILDHRNTNLVKQFISNINGEVISYRKTGICQRQHQNLLVALHRAKDFGTITFDFPMRIYDYSEWYNPKQMSS